MSAPDIAKAVPFEVVQNRIASKWNPTERNPHHAIYGQSGSGKSYLIRHGILPLCPLDRVLVIDVKGIDETWDGYGEVVTELPAQTTALNYRLNLSLYSDEDRKRRVLESTFDRVMDEGRWVLVIDEMQDTANLIGLKRGSRTERVINTGRAKGVTCIMGTQSPKWSEPALKSQAATIWFGHMRSHKDALELAKFAGYGNELVPAIKALDWREWLYVDSYDSEPLLGTTRVPTTSWRD